MHRLARVLAKGGTQAYFGGILQKTLLERFELVSYITLIFIGVRTKYMCI